MGKIHGSILAVHLRVIAFVGATLVCIVEHTVLEELVHDVTQFGPVVAVQNFIETVVWRWGAFHD